MLIHKKSALSAQALKMAFMFLVENNLLPYIYSRFHTSVLLLVLFYSHIFPKFK